MILAKTPHAKEGEFEALLSETSKLLTQSLAGIKEVEALSFEEMVCAKMREAATGSIFDGKIEQTRKAAFPDIVANKYYGVEVKTTIKDAWTSIGNSILETSREEEVERIYILFGKFGGGFEIIFRLYQECLPEISVTHSPRYKIDMKLPLGESIFEKIGIGYDQLREEGKQIQTIKTYYRNKLKDGEGLWWLDQESIENTVSPIIKSFNKQSKTEKEDFEVEAMILFPEILENKQSKYERLAAYLITSRNMVSANLRDRFSAGGQKEILIDGKPVKVKKIYYKLFNNAKKISDLIQRIDAEKLAYYWKVNKINSNRLDQWKKLVEKEIGTNGAELKTTKIFDAGLQ